MIATCPHCQSGFYIASDLAGKVVACSKCKKQVRAPDRRGFGPVEQPKDGIPIALLAENRVEVEERLKTETEGRFEAEKQLKEANEAKERAQEQSKVDLRARQDAEARLKIEFQARAAMEAKLLTETQARVRAEEDAMAAKQTVIEFESRLNAEIEEKLKAKAYAEDTDKKLIATEAKFKDSLRASRELELKLRDEEVALMKAETRADSEAESRAKMELLLKDEVEAKTKAESQTKLELMAKRKLQNQLADEINIREKAEEALSAAKTRLRDAEISSLIKEPINFKKGLVRLTIVLSLVMAWLSGSFAYRNGYVLWSHLDRPVRMPWGGQPVFLPLVLIAFCIGGFAAAWAAYLIAIFIIRGFRQSVTVDNNKNRYPKTKQNSEELVSSGTNKLWRSS